jgi:hypothetical protein
MSESGSITGECYVMLTSSLEDFPPIYSNATIDFKCTDNGQMNNSSNDSEMIDIKQFLPAMLHRSSNSVSPASSSSSTTADMSSLESPAKNAATSPSSSSSSSSSHSTGSTTSSSNYMRLGDDNDNHNNNLYSSGLDVEEEEKLNQMVDMGIDVSQALEALKKNNFDIAMVKK